MPSRTVAVIVAAVLAALAVSPAAESAGSLAHRTAQALRLAKRADRNARVALARTAPAGAQGPAGVNGVDGAAGTPGRDGAPGHDGAPAIAGAKGADGASIVGPAGPAGQDGQNAAPRPAPYSATNQNVVSLDPANRTPVATAHTFFAQPSPAVVLADVELRAVSTGDVTCALRLNGSTLEERAQTVTVGGIETLSLHTAHDAPSGSGDAEVACSGPARVGALGARVTVIS